MWFRISFEVSPMFFYKFFLLSFTIFILFLIYQNSEAYNILVLFENFQFLYNIMKAS